MTIKDIIRDLPRFRVRNTIDGRFFIERIETLRREYLVKEATMFKKAIYEWRTEDEVGVMRTDGRYSLSKDVSFDRIEFFNSKSRAINRAERELFEYFQDRCLSKGVNFSSDIEEIAMTEDQTVKHERKPVELDQNDLKDEIRKQRMVDL